jgi:hypothetical protein
MAILAAGAMVALYVCALASGAAVAATTTQATLYFNTFCESCQREVPLARRWISRHPQIPTLAVAFRTPTALGRTEGRRLGLRGPIVGDPDGVRAARDDVDEPTVIILQRGGHELRRIHFHALAASATASKSHGRSSQRTRRLCAPGRRPDRSLGMLRCLPVRPHCHHGTVLKRRRGGGGWVCARRVVRRPAVRQPAPPPPSMQPILPNVRTIASLDIPEIRQGAVHVQGFASWCYVCYRDQRYFALQAWQDAHPEAHEVAVTCMDGRQAASDFARERGWRFPVFVLETETWCMDVMERELGQTYWGANNFFVDGRLVRYDADCRFLDHPQAWWADFERERCLTPPTPPEPTPPVPPGDPIPPGDPGPGDPLSSATAR